MTDTTIVRRMSEPERELGALEARLKRGASRGRKRPFARLRGICPEARDLSEEEIRSAAIRLRLRP